MSIADLTAPFAADLTGPDTEIRRPPSNEEAEQALLGALLVKPVTIERVADFLRPEHFYFPVHGRIYKACLTLRERQQVADAVAVRSYFEQDEDLAELGGGEYVARLAGGVTSFRSVADYGRIVYELFLRRALIDIGDEIAETAYRTDMDLPSSDQIQAAEGRLYDLAETGDAGRGFRAFSDVMAVAVEQANKALNRDTHLTGTTTGLVDLDRMLGGLQSSDLVILAGRPAMGKSALAANMAYNAARAYLHSDGKEGAVAGFFSLEMSSEQLATRILSEVAQIPSEKIRKGEIARRDFPRLAEAAQEIDKTPLFLDDTAAITLSQLRTRSMRLKRQHHLGLIVVDYLQLMRPNPGTRIDNRVLEVSEITRGLKQLAKDLNVPVLALSQLSRQVEQREDKRPQLADLRESGSIEQDADVVMFVFREAYYVSKQEPTPGTPDHVTWQERMDRINNLAEVIIGKQRHGPTGTARLHFEGMFTRFSNLSREPEFDG